MRFICLFFCLISINLNAEIIYYNSNKSGMILEQIDRSNIDNYYITKETDNVKSTNLFIFYSSGKVVKSILEQYSNNFITLEKITAEENNTKNIDTYKDDLLLKNEVEKKSKIISVTDFIYNDKRELIKLILFDGNKNLVHSQLYYRNNDGGLREIFRTTDNGFYSHWFYKNDLISEYWLVEENRSTRTIYNLDGKKSVIEYYVNEILVSTYSFFYNNNILDYTIKISGDEKEVRQFNNDDTINESKIFSKDILVKQTKYLYQNKLLSNEIISGHGKKEEILYIRNESSDIIEIIQYVNGVIYKKQITENDESEIFEYYRDGVLYLKEYYLNGEKIKKDLFLDNKLFKSESYND